VKILNFDWGTFLDFVEPWEELAPSARRFLLDSKPKTVMAERAAGSDLPALLSGGFLRRLADGARVQTTEPFHEPHKALRSFARHTLLEHPDERTLREYLGDHFTNEERAGLDDAPYGDRDARVIDAVTSAGHVRGFLRSTDRRAWEKERLPERGWSSEQAWTQTEPMLAGKNAAADLACLIEALVAAKGPASFRALPALLASLPPARLGKAIAAGLRYLLCFPALDRELVPVLLLWPAVAERLARGPSSPPRPVEPHQTLCLAFRMEDVTQLLVRAAEPLRLKADGWRLFAAVERELERALLPLPAWLTQPRLFPGNAPGRRIHEALRLAQGLGLVTEQGTRGRDLGLVTTPAGWRWLGLEPLERLRTLLDLFRPEPERARTRPDADRGSGADDDATLFGELADDVAELEELLAEADEGEEVYEEEVVPFDGRFSRASVALSDASLFGAYGSHGLAREAIAAFARLAPGRAVPFGAFLRHEAETANPFVLPEFSRRVSLSSFGRPLAEEELEKLWIAGLERIFHEYLLPFGGVKAGLTREGSLTIELTSVGRYVLGLASEFVLELPAPEGGATPVRVQPDFEVVFVASHPSLEAAIGRFAERRGTGVGVLFRITRDSIVSAAQAGLGADEVLATLARASPTPVPANVEHEIRAWFGRCRRVALEPVQLLRCPDADTAARVLATVGTAKLESLSDTVLALLDPTQKTAIVRQCRKAGLFLTSRAEDPEAERLGRRKRWSRRSRWG